MKKNLLLAALALLAMGLPAGAYQYQKPVKSLKLPRTTLAEAGLPAQPFHDLLNTLEEEGIEMHSLMVAHGGQVVFEGFWTPYGPDTPHILHSLTKLFTNAAAGVAVTNGDLNLDDRLVDAFPDLVPENPSENLQKMTLRSLLTMTSGHGRMISGSEWRPLETSWLEAFFAEPVPYEPGTHYQYCSGNSYAVSAMVQKATAMTAQELLTQSGFGQLGMEHFTWDLSPEGISSGGSGVTCTTEDMLKVGTLYLNMGQWQGHQILTEEWCRMAIGLDPVYPDQGDYGFHWTNRRDGNYTAGGSYGQTIILIPDLDMVIAATAGTSRTEEEYGIINRCLIQPIREARQSATELNAEEEEGLRASLAHRGATLSLLENPVITDSPMAEHIDGKTYQASENDDQVTTIGFAVKPGVIEFTMTDHRGTHRIDNGVGQWLRGVTTMTGNYLHHQYQNPQEGYWAYAQWTDDSHLKLTWRYPAMAFVDWVELAFSDDGNTVSMTRSVNVNSGPLVRPEIHFQVQEAEQ